MIDLEQTPEAVRTAIARCAQEGGARVPRYRIDTLFGEAGRHHWTEVVPLAVCDHRFLVLGDLERRFAVRIVRYYHDYFSQLYRDCAWFASLPNGRAAGFLQVRETDGHTVGFVSLTGFTAHETPQRLLWRALRASGFLSRTAI